MMGPFASVLRRIGRVALPCLIACAAPAVASALCGDLSGDGRVFASDALAALRMVTQGGYDARADIGIAPGGAGADGAVKASDALQILRGALIGGVSSCAAATATRAIVVTAATDFATGGIAEIDLGTLSVKRHLLGFAAGDSVIRQTAQRTLILNRFAANNVQEIDLEHGLATLKQCSTRIGTNPHDIVAVTPTKAYVTLYDSRELAVVDLGVGSRCSGFVVGQVDMTSVADDDGIPEMDQSLILGSQLFVAVQLLDRDRFFLPTGPGAIALINTDTDVLEGVVNLQLENPFAETKGLVFDPYGQRIYVGGPGTLFSDLEDGGIEAIDPSVPASLGVVVTGADLGGDLTDFVIVGSARAYAIVADQAFVASVVEVDLVARAVVDTLLSTPFQLSDIEVTEDGLLCVADRNPFDPGLRCFDIATNNEVTSRPVYPGLSPFNFLFVE